MNCALSVMYSSASTKKFSTRNSALRTGFLFATTRIAEPTEVSASIQKRACATIVALHLQNHPAGSQRAARHSRERGNPGSPTPKTHRRQWTEHYRVPDQ